jgi:hypothetical protein
LPETKIALHDDSDFDALLAAAAAQTKAPLSVVIKDYWLTEALAVLARASDFRVIFKDQLYDVQRPQKFYDTLGGSSAFAFDPMLVAELSRRYDAERIYYGRKPTFSEIVDRIAAMRSRF